MNRQENARPMNPNLRFPGYANQPATQNRTTPLGSSRLQNASKIGNSWGFGAPTNGAPGLPNSQPRQTAPGSTSFAQTIGGSQPATPLDMSEFPSLSGTSQPQYQSANQAIWQRNVQQTAVQRPQQQQQHIVNPHISQSQHGNQQRADLSGTQSNEDMFTGSSHLQSALDDYRQDGQSVGQLTGSRQPQPTNIEDFPPLGRNGTNDSEGDQRSPFGAFSTSGAFSSQHNQNQSRQSVTNVQGNQGNQGSNTRSSSAIDRHMSPTAFGSATLNSRSPLENGRPDSSAILPDSERAKLPIGRGNQSNNSNLNSLLANFGDTRSPQQSQPDYSGRIGGTSPNPPVEALLSRIGTVDQQGLSGLLATITHEDPLVRGLAKGIDLNSLGMNLNSAEPLYETWGGPFAEAGSRPLQPDFQLPECYTVDNVHRVREKIPGFTDETLFYIFYTQPRDIMQELAATELHNRNWRFHKGLQMWLTKDPSLPEPMRPDPKGERGSYIFFDQSRWDKVRQADFFLVYEDLAPTLGRPNGQ